MGHTSNKDIRIAKSVVDYIARWLGLTFMSGHDHVPTATDNTNNGNGSEVSPAPASPVMDGLKEDAGAAVALAERATLLASIGETGNGSTSPAASTEGTGNGQGDQFARFQIDAPSCDNCGSITVRNGNCYLCHNCGNSMGCS